MVCVAHSRKEEKIDLNRCHIEGDRGCPGLSRDDQINFSPTPPGRSQRRKTSIRILLNPVGVILTPPPPEAEEENARHLSCAIESGIYSY